MTSLSVPTCLRLAGVLAAVCSNAAQLSRAPHRRRAAARAEFGRRLPRLDDDLSVSIDLSLSLSMPTAEEFPSDADADGVETVDLGGGDGGSGKPVLAALLAGLTAAAAGTGGFLVRKRRRDVSADESLREAAEMVAREGAAASPVARDLSPVALPAFANEESPPRGPYSPREEASPGPKLAEMRLPLADMFRSPRCAEEGGQEDVEVELRDVELV